MAEVSDIKEVFKSFNPNEDADGTIAKAILPRFNTPLGDTDDKSLNASFGLEAYLKAAADLNPDNGPRVIDRIVEAYQKANYRSLDEILKAIDIPANALTFARMSYMPDTTNSGILQWPGIHPEALRKIVRENIAPNLIIGMRCDDVLRYGNPSNHLWRPGWRLEVFQGDKNPSTQDKKDFLAAQDFLSNSSIDFSYAEALDRDTENLTDFHRFLLSITRDSLTFDMIAISTERDGNDRVLRYAPIPAGNIRLVGPAGYEQNPEAYAVMVDEGGVVKKVYTRKDLILYSRNVRTDPEYAVSMSRGYGYPEIEQSLRLIQGFQNVVDFNVDVFNRSGVPHGILLLTGAGWVQRQVDALTRMWRNLKTGITKALALPVLAAPQNGDVKVVDFSPVVGKEALYQDLLNIMIGCFCSMYRFPVQRLGYRTSGQRTPTEVSSDSPIKALDDDDPGRIALLTHLASLINQNFIWPRWPNLKFVWTGLHPKEDAREYEFRRNALTWKEARAEADLPELKSVVKGEDLKELVELMEMAPIDPNLSGIFQAIASAKFKAEADQAMMEQQGAGPGNTMQSKKDPAKSEAHGHTSGVRRDSHSEKQSASS